MHTMQLFCPRQSCWLLVRASESRERDIVLVLGLPPTLNMVGMDSLRQSQQLAIGSQVGTYRKRCPGDTHRLLRALTAKCGV